MRVSKNRTGWQPKSNSKAIGVISDIIFQLSSLARTLGLKQNVNLESHVRVTFSKDSNLPDMTNSITEIPDARVVGNTALVFIIYNSKCRCGEMVAHTIFSPNTG